MAAGAETKQTLTGIQFGRAAAAILVVLYHGGRMLPPYLGDIGAAQYFKFGNAGVDFFFVLSGFIIFYVHEADIGRPFRLGRYLFNRLTRIYPIYWVAFALSFLLLVTKQNWAELSPSHLASSFLLLPEPVEPVVGVAWTLCHEVAFYAAFATLIASRTVGRIVISAWAVLVVAGCFAPHQQFGLRFLESPYHIEFAMGALTAFLTRRGPLKIAPFLAVLGLVAFGIAGIFLHQHLIHNSVLARMVYGSCSALIIYGLAVWETSGGISFPRWASFLGAASYSIYLFHTYLLGWIGRAGSFLVPANYASNIFYFLLVAGVVAGGCLIYAMVEGPLMKMLRELRMPKPVSAPA